MKQGYISTGIAVIIFLLAAFPAFADIRLPAVISDNMVLQQNTRVALWGWADKDEKITISTSWNKQVVRVTADDNGNWKAYLNTIKYGGPYTITFQGKNIISLVNILLGEVWLCSGQSNMAFSLEKQQSWMTGVLNAEQEIAQADHPNMRFFSVQRNTSGAPADDLGGDWKLCSPANAGKFSAVAYYFGKEIMKATGIPVGLIHSSWGGTPAEAWVSKNTLMEDADFKAIIDRFNQSVNDSITSHQIYSEQLRRWNSDSVTMKEKGDMKTAPQKPTPFKYHQAPAHLYNAMIHPLIPFTLKGVIWYQGESNASRAYQYRKLFPSLINSWRKEWGSELPFYFVQIAPYRGQNPEIREAQLLTYKTVHNTGMAVITDAGDSADIHPRNKEIVGRRLSLWALAKNYAKKDIIYSGPLYRSMKVEGDNIRIHFDFSEGLMIRDATVLTEFTIAGANRQFIPAQARIEGNTVVVSAVGVKQPVSVRFAWKNFMRPNLYNKAELPASPFRTDDWPGETFGKN